MLIRNSLKYGGAVAAYLPLATKIGPGAYLKSGQLGVADTSHGILSFDIKCIAGSQANPNDGGFFNVHNRDILGNVFTLFQSEGVPGINIAADNAGGVVGTLRINFADNSGVPTSGTNKAITQVIPGFFLDKAGVFGNITVIYSLATSGARHVYTYWNGALVQADGLTEFNNGFNSAPAAIAGTFTPFIMANTAGFAIGQCGAAASLGAAFDISRLILDTSHTDDAAVSQAAATARAADIWSGGPKDLGVGGANLFGTQLQIYHVGDAAHFPTELGSLTPAWTTTISGTQPGGPALVWDAAVGPGGPVNTRPYDKWNVAETLVPAASAVTSNRNCPIALNDFLVVIAYATNNTTSVDYGMTINQGFVVPTHTGATIPVVNNDTNGRPNNLGIWTKKAVAGDVTAAGSNWALAPTVTFATAPDRGIAWIVLNFGPITGIDVMDAAIAAAGSASHLITASDAGISTTAKGLLLTVVSLYGMPDYTTAGVSAITLPADQRAINATLFGTSSQPSINISAEPINAAGAVGARTCNSASYTSAFAAGKPTTLSILLK